MRVAWLAVLLFLAAVLNVPGASALGCQDGTNPVLIGSFQVCLLQYQTHDDGGPCGHDRSYSNTPVQGFAVHRTGPVQAYAAAGVTQYAYDYDLAAPCGGPASGSGKGTSAGVNGVVSGQYFGAGFGQRHDVVERDGASGETKDTAAGAGALIVGGGVEQRSTSTTGEEGTHRGKDTRVTLGVGATAPPIQVADQEVRDGECTILLGGGGLFSQPCGPVPVIPDAPEMPDFPHL